VPTK
jgi:GNAT superfamily N-acetyltransferase